MSSKPSCKVHRCSEPPLQHDGVILPFCTKHTRVEVVHQFGEGSPEVQLFDLGITMGRLGQEVN